MLTSTITTFFDLCGYREAIRSAQVEVLVTTQGDFLTEFTHIDLNKLSLKIMRHGSSYTEIRTLATLIIDRPPQVHLPTGDRGEDFVEMPPPGRQRAFDPKPTRVDRTEMDHPSVDRLMRDGDPALGEQVLDIPVAENGRAVRVSVASTLFG